MGQGDPHPGFDLLHQVMDRLAAIVAREEPN